MRWGKGIDVGVGGGREQGRIAIAAFVVVDDAAAAAKGIAVAVVRRSTCEVVHLGGRVGKGKGGEVGKRGLGEKNS